MSGRIESAQADGYVNHSLKVKYVTPITLDQFLKTTGLVGTGGQAKIAIQEGYVTVNGELETRRRRKLALGDVIVVDSEHRFVVTEEVIRRP